MNTYVLAALAVVLVSGMISLCEGKCGKTKISDSVSFCASRNRLILLFLIGIYISVKTKFHIYFFFKYTIMWVDYFFFRCFTGNAAWNSYYYGNMRSPSRRSISRPTTRSPVYRRYPNPYRSTTRRYYPKPSPRRQRNYYMERKPTTASPVTEPPTPTTTTSGPLTAKPFTPQPYLYQMMSKSIKYPYFSLFSYNFINVYIHV